VTQSELHALLGSRWALPILTALVVSEDGALRFGQLKAAISVSGRMLAQTTRALADAGLMSRVDETARTGVHAVIYSLTAQGRTILDWSAEWPKTEGTP